MKTTEGKFKTLQYSVMHCMRHTFRKREKPQMEEPFNCNIKIQLFKIYILQS